MAFVETLDPFLADFAVSATIGGATVSGIFDKEFALAYDTVGGTSPAFQAPTASFSGVVRGTAVTIGGVGYLVTSKQDDGTGWTVLLLELA